MNFLMDRNSRTPAKLAWITLKSMETLSRVMISDGR